MQSVPYGERGGGRRESSTHELLQRSQLVVRLGKQRLLVLLLPQGNQRSLLVASTEAISSDLSFTGEDDFDLRNRGVSVVLQRSELGGMAEKRRRRKSDERVSGTA